MNFEKCLLTIKLLIKCLENRLQSKAFSISFQSSQKIKSQKRVLSNVKRLKYFVYT
jgi:hypothetical protein